MWSNSARSRLGVVDVETAVQGSDQVWDLGPEST
jgi:hypothetical protein